MKHLLSIKDLSKDDILHLIDLSLRFKNSEIGFYTKAPRNIVKIFLEPSTRTSLSFEVACKKLNIHCSNLDLSQSSISKGETLQDTFLNLEALGFEGAIVRLKEEKLLKEISEKTNLSLISAGEGRLHHPSQAILDALTIYEEFKTLDNLRIGIVGDINHSRVASSFLDLMSFFDSKVLVYQPEMFGEIRSNKFISGEFSEIYKKSDVVMMLRNQFERHVDLNINKESFLKDFGLNDERLELLKNKAIIMHPGPMNIGVEISKKASQSKKSRILTQVQNGVFARMAILKEVLRG